ncbi:MAG TPA: hypothetical protein VFX70_04520 [Mycobacteriales bacterium]|nr:hypothetical protein [Mycobacteriales bacterium]
MHVLVPFPRALARMATLLMCALPLAATGLPAAYAATTVTVTSTVAQSSAHVTPMDTCHSADGTPCKQR